LESISIYRVVNTLNSYLNITRPIIRRCGIWTCNQCIHKFRFPRIRLHWIWQL